MRNKDNRFAPFSGSWGKVTWVECTRRGVAWQWFHARGWL